MKIFLIILFGFYYYGACGQGVESSVIELKIIHDTIRTQVAGHKVVVEYSVKNVSDTNLILYRLGSKVSPFPSKQTDKLCNQKKTGAGTVFLLFDKNLKWISGTHWIISDYTRKMTKERADSAMAVANANSLKETIVLKMSETIVLKQEIDTMPFSLFRGCYYLELIYSAGEKIDLFVSEEQLASDSRIHKAKVFQGCIRSQKAVIVVN